MEGKNQPEKVKGKSQPNKFLAFLIFIGGVICTYLLLF